MNGSMAQSPPTARRGRRGSALLIVLVAMVVLAVLSSASMMSAFQEARSSRAAQIQQRAVTVAEYGLNLQLGHWTPTRSAMALGAIDSSTIGVALGDTAVVRIQRLTGVDYHVVSVGRAGVGNGLLEAQRQVSLLVRMSTPSIRPGGIITSFGDVDIQGSPTVTGRNTTPPGWAGCPTSGGDTVAISYRPGADVKVQKPDKQAIGGTRPDPRAGESSSYDWAALIARANVRLTGNISPAPSGSSSSCNRYSSNWGEPWRGFVAVAGCQDYLPIVYAPGDLDLENGRGQGILIVDGRLRVRGNFEYVGLILVRDEFEAQGNISLHGAIISRNADGAETRVRGNAYMAYSRCAVDRALGALATPTRVKQRAWANVY